MALDPLMLARIGFGLGAAFAAAFAIVPVSLGWLLLYFRLRGDRRDGRAWEEAHALWTKVFALTFALAAISGVALALQFASDWPGFTNKAGAVAGPLIARDLLAWLFLAAMLGIGIPLFGSARLPPAVGAVATLIAAASATAALVPPMALASWMQTPAGFEMEGDVVTPGNWVRAFLNPSFGYRLAHTLLASGLTTGFLVAGFSALRRLRGDRSVATWLALRTGVAVAAVLIPLQIAAGYLHGLNTLRYQPAKVAAIAANWTSRGNAPLVLSGWPDAEAGKNRWEIAIPDGASLLLRHRADGAVPGLANYSGNHPPVAPVFFAFRVMAGIGLLMLAVSWLAAYFVFGRKSLPRWLSWVLVAMAASGWIATVAGWCVAEIGRQPWLVFDVLKTAAAAPASGAWAAVSLAGHLALDCALAAIMCVALLKLARTPAGPRTAHPAATDGS